MTEDEWGVASAETEFELRRRLSGNEEVGSYRGYTLFKSAGGTFGFNAWMNKTQWGWYCPYTDVDGAKKAIDAILAYNEWVK